MRSTVVAGCLSLFAALAGCHDEPGAPGAHEPQASSKPQAVLLSTRSDGLVETRTAKGTQVQLGGRFESAVIARRNPDGSITTECHDDQEQAEAFLQAAPVRANTPEAQ